MHRVVIHLCSPLLCQTSWLQRQLLKDGMILLTICVGIVSVQHQVLTISLSHGIVTRTELVYRMLVTLLYVSKQWGYTGEQSNKITFALSYPKAVLGIMVTTGDGIPQNPVDVTLSGATAVGYNSAGCKTYWLAYGI